MSSLKEDKPKLAQFIQNDFFREYAILYGKGSKKKGSPKEDTEESSAKPEPSKPETPKKADAPKKEDAPKKVDTSKNVDTPKKVDAPKKEDAPKVRAIEAGPIWGGYDAEIKCPKTCKGDNLWHKKEWWTTIGGRMSVCNCIVKD
jgi:hypothetical protein